jgi:hypothetical protein
MYLLFFVLTLIATTAVALLVPLEQWSAANILGYLAILVALWTIPIVGKREKSNTTIANFGAILGLGPINLAASITAFIYSFRVDAPLKELLNIGAFSISLLILLLMRISSKIINMNQRSDEEDTSFKNIKDRLWRLKLRSNDKSVVKFISLLVQDIEYYPTWNENPPSNIGKIGELMESIEAGETDSFPEFQLKQLVNLKFALAAAREEIMLSRGIRLNSATDV